MAATKAAEISRLEHAELAARERRLAAEAEADRLLEAARQTVRKIEAGVEARIAAALADLRRSQLERAEAEVAAIEDELASRVRQPVTAPSASPAFEATVELAVGAVLGETGR